MATENGARIQLSWKVGPLGKVDYGFGSVLSSAGATVLRHLTSRPLAARLDVVVSELVNNVLENTADDSTGIAVDLKVDGGSMEVRVGNSVSPEVFEQVRRHVTAIRRHPNPRELLATTMKGRRSQGEHGGLGLIRLVSEARARISVAYDKKRCWMRVTARVPLGGEQ